jgi:prepilin-type processing-associated H-X9-DG protein
LKLLQCPSTPQANRVATGTDDDFTFTAAAGDYAPVTRVSNGLAEKGLVDRAGPGALKADGGGAPRFADITDGTSHTILIGEDAGRPQLYRKGLAVPGGENYVGGAAWASPSADFGVDGSRGSDGALADPRSCALNCTNDNEAYGFHTGGCQFLFADGHVQFIQSGIRLRTFARLITPRGGEVVSENDF